MGDPNLEMTEDSTPVRRPDRDWRRLVRQAVRYGVSAGLGLVVNVTLLVVLVEWVGLSTTTAPVVSLAVALSVTLGLTDHWVFRRHRSRDLRTVAERTPAYLLVMLVGKAVNYGIYLALTTAGVPYPVAWVTGTGVVFVGTFSANRVVWQRPTSGTEATDD